MPIVTVEECQKRCNECGLLPFGRQLCHAYNVIKKALQDLNQQPQTPELRAQVAEECRAVWAVSIANAVHIGLVVYDGDALEVLKSVHEVLAKMLEDMPSRLKEHIARETLAGRVSADAWKSTKPESMN